MSSKSARFGAKEKWWQRCFSCFKRHPVCSLKEHFNLNGLFITSARVAVHVLVRTKWIKKRILMTCWNGFESALLCRLQRSISNDSVRCAGRNLWPQLIFALNAANCVLRQSLGQRLHRKSNLFACQWTARPELCLFPANPPCNYSKWLPFFRHRMFITLRSISISLDFDAIPVVYFVANFTQITVKPPRSSWCDRTGEQVY